MCRIHFVWGVGLLAFGLGILLSCFCESICLRVLLGLILVGSGCLFCRK